MLCGKRPNASGSWENILFTSEKLFLNKQMHNCMYKCEWMNASMSDYLFSVYHLVLRYL
jgi:hypothetical protein